MHLKYRGDRTQPYRHNRRVGLIGKVVGPNQRGEWLIVTEATYDPEQDVTFATAERILSPEHALERALADQASA